MSMYPIVEEPEPVAWIEQRSHTHGWYVYLLETDYGWHKIGSSSDPARRMATIGILLPFDVRTTHVIQSDRAILLEKKLHKRFADKHLNGEWFSLNAADVAFIKTLPTNMTNEHVLDIIFDGETYDYRFRNRIRYSDVDWHSLDISMSRLEFILLREFADVKSYVEGDGINPIFREAVDALEARQWIDNSRYGERSTYRMIREGRRTWDRIVESYHNHAPITIDRVLIDQRLQDGVIQLGMFGEDGRVIVREPVKP